jgi:hypothetical protein
MIISKLLGGGGAAAPPVATALQLYQFKFKKLAGRAAVQQMRQRDPLMCSSTISFLSSKNWE